MSELGWLIAAVIGAVVVLVGVLTLAQRAASVQYMEALEPYIWQAIAIAFKASDYAVDTFGHRLDGVDRSVLADRVYDYIPAVIEFKGVKLPVKELCDRKQFSLAVQVAYDRMIALYMQGQAGWEQSVGELLAQHVSPEPRP